MDMYSVTNEHTGGKEIFFVYIIFILNKMNVLPIKMNHILFNKELLCNITYIHLYKYTCIYMYYFIYMYLSITL